MTTDEAAIIRSVQAGRREDFAVLVRAHEARVRSLCLSLLRRPAEAEDAAQDAFLKAFRALPSFRSQSSFSTWIYRIAYRHCLDVLRAAKRRAEEPLDAFPGEPPAPEASAEAAAALDVLASLPEEHRVVLTLREGRGFTYEEMARTLDVSLDAVKGRLKRARRALARHFSALSGV